jgi:hypothetical protein
MDIYHAMRELEEFKYRVKALELDYEIKTWNQYRLACGWSAQRDSIKK